MDAGRQAEELASRCVALIVYDQHDARKKPNGPAIKAEIRAVASEARGRGISPSAIADEVSAGLHDRYEPATARRLHREFLAAFSAGVQPGPASMAD